MATALVRGEVPDTDCSVCHEAFKEPKIMPCGHVVCQPCLLSWIRAQPQAGCPLCRCAVLETEGQPESMEEEVGALPTDLALAELVEARALLDKDHSCCVCEDVAATALCLHCGDMLCAFCTKAHRKLTTTKHHKLADLSSLTPKSLADSRPSTCSSHPDEQCNQFCPTHGVSICVLCAVVGHKSCPDIKDMEKETKNARVKLANIAASLSATESELSEAILRLDRHVHLTDERVQASITLIQETCDQLESIIKIYRSRMKDLAHSKGSDIKKKAQAAKTILHQRKSRVTSHSLVVTRAGESQTDATVRKMSAVLAKRVQLLDCGVTLPVSDVLTTMEFSVDEGFVSTVEKALIKLGRVNLVPADDLEIRHREFTFHENHGGQIVLGRDQNSAQRDEGYGCGYVVSKEHLEINMLYEVRLDELRTGSWLAVGVLTVSPDSVDLTSGFSKNLLPVTAVSKIGWKSNGTEDFIPCEVSSTLMKELRQGDRVGVTLDPLRLPNIYVNGKSRLVWNSKKPVTGTGYAFLELTGNARVTALPPVHVINK